MNYIKAIVNNCIKKQDNRGLSLVEMIASLVIMSLIGLGVGGLIVAGSRYFRMSIAETDLQEEAQLVKNYLNNMIVDTTLAIGRIENLGATPGDGGITNGDNCIFVCTPEDVRFIALDNSEKKLMYMETTLEDVTVKDPTTGKLTINVDKILRVSPPEGTDPRPISSWTLLADHVTKFDVTNSLENINKQFRIFNCSLEFKIREERKYVTTHTINLRNDIFNVDDGDLTSAYEYVDVHNPTVAIVSVTPMSPSASVGGNIQFHAAVQGTNYPSQEVTWKVSGLEDFGDSKTKAENKADGTTIDENGFLVIAENETCKMLYVRATSVLDNEKAGTALVRIAYLNSASIDKRENATPDDKGCYNIGQTVPLVVKAEVTFADDTIGTSTDSLSYTWNVEDIYIPDTDSNDSYIDALPMDSSKGYHVETKDVAGSKLSERVVASSNGAEADFYIASSMPPNSIIHVTASVTMSGKKVDASYEIRVSDKEASGLDVKANPTTYTLNRKGEIQFWGTVLDHEDASITWNISLPASLKGKVGFDKEFKSITTTSKSGDTNPIRIYASNTIDYTSKETFTLTATYSNAVTNQEMIEDRVITIPPVSIAFEPEKNNPIVVVGKPWRVGVNVVGLEADAEDITFKSSDYIKNMVGPIYSPVNKTMVISVTPPETGKRFSEYQKTIIKAAMKSNAKVTGSITVHVFLSNIIVTGKNYCYVPVPRDPKPYFPASDDDSLLPVDDKGEYKHRMGDIDYSYFVDDNGWGVKIFGVVDKNNNPIKYYYKDVKNNPIKFYYNND